MTKSPENEIIGAQCTCVLKSDKHHFVVFKRLKTCKCYFQVILTKEACSPAIKVTWPQQVLSSELCHVGQAALGLTVLGFELTCNL